MRIHLLPASLLFISASLAACKPTPSAATPTEPPPEDAAVAPADTSGAAVASAPTDGTSSSPSAAPDSIDYRAIVAASDRSEDDKKLDAGRHPSELLEFFAVKPGMHIAELAAGGGYTAELLVRSVGPQGKVYGQNTPFLLQRFAEAPWSERLKKPVMRDVVRIDSEFNDPLPGHTADLDAVFMVLFYHDTVWLKTDRKRMNQAIFAALKPGGEFAVVDHSAQAGAGVSQAETLHRIEESVVTQEIQSAGFVLEKSADFLRNSAEQRNWSASPRTAGELRGTSDRFVLLFRKPLDAPAPTQPGTSTVCTDPRSTACTRDYRPVCASASTGIVCIKAPCPSTELKTFANACTACADPKVLSHTPGACAQK